MARKKKADIEAEKASSETTPLPEDAVETTEIIDDSAKLVEQSPQKPAAANRNRPGGRSAAEQKKLDETTKEKRFLVKNGGRILHRGMLTKLRPGKIIKEHDYNCPQLRQQGIVLEEVTE